MIVSGRVCCLLSLQAMDFGRLRTLLLVSTMLHVHPHRDDHRVQHSSLCVRRLFVARRGQPLLHPGSLLCVVLSGLVKFSYICVAIFAICWSVCDRIVFFVSGSHVRYGIDIISVSVPSLVCVCVELSLGVLECVCVFSKQVFL